MKRKCTLIIAFLGASMSYAQVLISDNNDSKEPNPSSILELNSDDKGLLIPRIEDMKNIPKPIPEGMIVYNAEHKCFQGWNGKKWADITECTGTPLTREFNLTYSEDFNEFRGKGFMPE